MFRKKLMTNFINQVKVSNITYMNDYDDLFKVYLESYRQQYPTVTSLCSHIRIKFQGKIYDFLKQLVSDVSSTAVLNFVDRKTGIIYDSNLMLMFSIDENKFNLFDANQFAEIYIYLYSSDIEKLQTLDFLIKEKYRKTNSKIQWYFKGDGIEHVEMDLLVSNIIFPEYYPYIKDPLTLGERFLNSNKNVLILLGPPGTGKTSFIRYILNSLNKNAVTSYDPEIMGMDNFYIEYINSNNNFMVLEDSDILLLNREQDDNRVMSKILNSSDGLVDTSGKKFIFTANLLSNAKIDDALVRPGRCFDVISFRSLTYAESVKAAERLGVTLSETNREYNLSEIFNPGKIFKKSKVGF